MILPFTVLWHRPLAARHLILVANEIAAAKGFQPGGDLHHHHGAGGTQHPALF